MQSAGLDAGGHQWGGAGADMDEWVGECEEAAKVALQYLHARTHMQPSDGCEH